MKKVLVICEWDLVGLRLTELFGALFNTEKKQLYYCTIDLAHCHQQIKATALRSGKSLVGDTSFVIQQQLNHIDPHKTLSANSCREINEMISTLNINLVILPNYLYDEQRQAQYDNIVKEIKKSSKIDVIGLYI